jgi:hypothetical protein
MSADLFSGEIIMDSPCRKKKVGIRLASAPEYPPLTWGRYTASVGDHKKPPNFWRSVTELSMRSGLNLLYFVPLYLNLLKNLKNVYIRPQKT